MSVDIDIEEDVKEKEIQIQDEELDVKEEDVKDPGEMEGKEKKHEPKEGSPRWNEMYGKLKEMERTVEDLRGDESTQAALVKEMAAHNKKMAKAMDKMSEAVTASPEDDEVNVAAERVVDIQDEIKQLRDTRKEARAEYDHEKADELGDKIHDLELEMRDVKREAEKAPAAKEQQLSVSVQAELNEALAEFTANAPWADPDHDDFDEDMRAAAVSMDKRLMGQPKWADESLSDRFAHVQEKIEKKFGVESKEPAEQKEPVPKKKSKAPTVEGGRKSTGGDGNKTVKLSKEELAIASGFDMTPEEFARQKALGG